MDAAIVRPADGVIEIESGARHSDEDAGALQKSVGLMHRRHAASGNPAHLSDGGRLRTRYKGATIDPLADQIHDPFGSLHAPLPASNTAVRSSAKLVTTRVATWPRHRRGDGGARRSDYRGRGRGRPRPNDVIVCCKSAANGCNLAFVFNCADGNVRILSLLSGLAPTYGPS